MSQDELIDQLKRSKYIWAVHEDEENWLSQGGCFVLIKELILVLYRVGFTRIEYQTLFGDGRYLCRFRSLSQTQAAELRGRGFTLCPPCFEYLGVPSARTEIDELDMALASRPVIGDMDSDREREATYSRSGINLDFEDLSGCKNAPRFFQLMHQRLAGYISSVELVENRPNTFRIVLNGRINRRLLFALLGKPQGQEEELVYFIRGLVAHGLSTNLLTDIAILQGEKISTFAVNPANGSLLTRLTQHPSERHSSLQITVSPEAMPAFRKMFLRKFFSAVTLRDKIGDIPPDARPDIARSRLNRLVRVACAAALLPALGLTSWLAIKTILSGDIPSWSPDIKKLADVIRDPNWGRGGNIKVRVSDPTVWEKYAPVNAVSPRPGRSLEEISSTYSQSDAQIGSSDNGSDGDSPDGAGSSEEEIDSVQNFQVVEHPTEAQLAQLDILKYYFEHTTGYVIPNSWFLFTGEGAKGLNMGGQRIGLHVEVLEAGWEEARKVLTHEVAHNGANGHNRKFAGMQADLDSAQIDAWGDIARVPEPERTPEENAVVGAEQAWDHLRSGGQLSDIAPIYWNGQGKPEPAKK